MYVWAMPQKLPVNGFKWVEDLSKFNENFIKSYNEKSNERHFLVVDVQYSEHLHELHNDLPFLPEIKKVEKIKKLVANLQDKKIYYTHDKSKMSIKSQISFKKKSQSH